MTGCGVMLAFMLLVLGDVLMALLATGAGGQEERPVLPEGPGLTARYPGDGGLADDPAVVLAEDFEAPTIKEVTKQWESVQGTMALSDDVPAGSAGERSLLTSQVGGQGTGCTLYRRLPCTLPVAQATCLKRARRLGTQNCRRLTTAARVSEHPGSTSLRVGTGRELTNLCTRVRLTVCRPSA